MEKQFILRVVCQHLQWAFKSVPPIPAWMGLDYSSDFIAQRTLTTRPKLYG